MNEQRKRGNMKDKFLDALACAIMLTIPVSIVVFITLLTAAYPKIGASFIVLLVVVLASPWAVKRVESKI